ncbi:MAG: tRNA (adenosine(37)-N6)-threonylcarbamoyltransferase complex ATPase subunit type 1 TsaE [Bacteroidota bacterium]
MSERVYLSRSLSDNYSIAKSILESCTNERIFAFYGELGAGKTTLIKLFCEILGVHEPVTSPTFNLIHEYPGADGLVVHMDLYRLQNEDEAYEIGLLDYFQKGHYTFIEWPERIPSLLPSDTIHLHISVQTDHSRKIELTHTVHGQV